VLGQTRRQGHRFTKAPAQGVWLPAALTTLLVVPSIAWVALDRSIWPWDPAWYGEVTVDLWAAVRGGPSWAGVMTHAFGAKPPAIAWFGQLFVPLRHVFGREATSLLLSVITCEAISIALVYRTLDRATGRLGGIVGALALGSAPLFVAMGHEYFAEPIQTVSSAWVLLILASSRSWRPALVYAQVPGVLAFGLLCKLSAPIYLAIPTAAALLLSRLNRRPIAGGPSPWRDRAVVVSAAASLALVLGAAAWYSVNLHSAVEHARAASADNGLYGVNHGFGTELLDWLGRTRDVAFLPPVAALLLVLLVAALGWALTRRHRPSLLDTKVVLAGAAGLTLVVVLAAFSSQPNNEPRYLLPILPNIAILAGLAFSAAGPAIVAVAACLVLGAQFGLVTLQSFGVFHPSWLVSYPLTKPAPKTTMARQLDAIVDATCTLSAANKINIVGVAYPWLNANTLEMLAAERYAETGRYCYYTSLGYASSDPIADWRRVLGLQPPYYISLDYGNRSNPPPPELQTAIATPDPFNRTNVAVFRRVRTSGDYEILNGTRRAGTVVLVAVSGR
jgi:4-amino-4-deoxy-L-arabinose transferase-like glycosyltransferase